MCVTDRQRERVDVEWGGCRGYGQVSISRCGGGHVYLLWCEEGNGGGVVVGGDNF